MDAPPKILVIGAGGTIQEIIAMTTLEPTWRCTAVDRSEPDVEGRAQQVEANKSLQRASMHLGHVEDLAVDKSYDAGTLICVFHHLNGDALKRKILRSIRTHLKSGAPLIVRGQSLSLCKTTVMVARLG